MKTTRISFVMTLILSTILMASCSSENDEERLYVPDFGENVVINHSDDYDNDEVFTIYMPATNSNASEETGAMNYAAYLLQQAGFNIRFERFEYSLSYLRTAMRSGNEKSVHIATIQSALILNQEALLGNFHEELLIYAPSFHYIISDIRVPDIPFNIPTEVMRIPISPAILMRNDIYREHEQPITTVQEYENLLIRLRDQGSVSAPGLFATILSDRWWGRDFGYAPLNLFLNDAGYMPLTGMFLQEAGISNPLWRNEEDGEIAAFFNIPEAINAIIRPLELRDAGLVEIWDGEQEVGDIFPTILIDSAFNSFHLLGINPDLYTMQVFPKASSAIISTLGSGGGAIASANADLSEFFRFLEWLTVVDNYRFFMFGIEGEDYLSDDMGYISELLNPDYSGWGGRMYFRNDKMLQQIFHQSQASLDYHEALDAVPLPEFPLDVDGRLSVGFELATNDAFSDAMNRIAGEMDTLLQQIYGTHIETEMARSMVEEVFERSGRVIGINLAEQLTREELGLE